MPFETKIRKARFGAPGISPQGMKSLADSLLTSIKARLDRGQDIYDTAAPPLTDRYRTRKERKYGSGIRDLRFTGRTRRGMVVLSAQQNQAVIGFSDTEAARRVKLNNIRSRQWGVSEQNDRDLFMAFQNLGERPVTVIEEK